MCTHRHGRANTDRKAEAHTDTKTHTDTEMHTDTKTHTDTEMHTDRHLSRKSCRAFGYPACSTRRDGCCSGAAATAAETTSSIAVHVWWATPPGPGWCVRVV